MFLRIEAWRISLDEFYKLMALRDTASRSDGRRARKNRRRMSCGLKGVLGVVDVAEDAATDTQDHWAVPPKQGGEGVFFVPFNEAGQQFAIAWGLLRRGGDSAKVVERKLFVDAASSLIRSARLVPRSAASE